ncbi:MAG: ABC transporter permease [Planctomycetia bacterium]|nr:ABC transporter permease [Planctomycetia bacterium]
MSRPQASLAGLAAEALPAVAVAVGVVAFWQFGVAHWQVPAYLLPSPAAVATAGWEKRATLLHAVWVTARAAVVGLTAAAVVGTLLAILFSQSRIIRTALYPYVLFLQTVPIVAIAPLLITWSGYGERTVILVSAIIALFPILSNVTAGLLALDPNHRDLFRLYRAGRWPTLLRLRLPTAMGHLALGLRISCGLAVIGAIVGEFFVGRGSDFPGLGAVMDRWLAMGKTDALIAAVLLSSLLGLAMFAAVNLVTDRLLHHYVQGTGD